MMMKVNNAGYLERQSVGSRGCTKAKYRNWWMVKYRGGSNKGFVRIGDLILPEKMVGKRIRLKLEVIDDEKEKM